MKINLTPTPDRTKRLCEGLWKPAVDADKVRNVQTWMAASPHDGEAFSIIGGLDDIGIAIPDWRWHLSIAGETRVPSWDEMAAMLHAARPGVPFALGVPPRSWWINIHQHCLHAWQVNDENLLAQWRAERRGHTPS